ncbi:hypothetical protein ANO11243_090320 [Dothideomycetidae sp. 11243]|nr:hypothetical protein ANO11243_090320 [fungal sp. No.11243]
MANGKWGDTLHHAKHKTLAVAAQRSEKSKKRVLAVRTASTPAPTRGRLVLALTPPTLERCDAIAAIAAIRSLCRTPSEVEPRCSQLQRYGGVRIFVHVCVLWLAPAHAAFLSASVSGTLPGRVGFHVACRGWARPRNRAVLGVVVRQTLSTMMSASASAIVRPTALTASTAAGTEYFSRSAEGRMLNAK